MKPFKKMTFTAKGPDGRTVVEEFTETIKIDAYGRFCCIIPDQLVAIAQDIAKGPTCRGLSSGMVVESSTDGRMYVKCKTFDELVSVINGIIKDHSTPVITEELVIRYNVESHVSFCVTPDGIIRRNGNDVEGTEWTYKECNWDTSKKYGSHSATSPCSGGYSLTIGAEAMRKITTRYGTSVKVKYETYYGDGNHLQSKCPASRLNSWCSFILPSAKEMPYSDDAAIFFDNMMMRMAEMNRLVQSFCFDQDVLMKLISEKKGPFALEAPKE